MAKSYSEQLDSVQAAIAKIEAGAQDEIYEGNRRTYADLPALYERERWLRQMVERESPSGARGIRYGVPS